MRPVCWRAVIPFIGIPALIADSVALAAARSVARRAPAGAVHAD